MIIKTKEFNLKDTITSGQCFRWTEKEDNSYTIILNDRVINIRQNNNELIIKSSDNKNLKQKIIDYFDLKRNYDDINKEICKKDKKMKKIIESCKGYKIMNQDSFEMCISYIISQNNNVKRISKTIENISKNYGQKVIFNNEDYYLFPKYEDIKNISIDELRNYGVGFRDKYIRNFLDALKENPNLINDINSLNTIDALKKLMIIKGIGLKVASCILLFGFRRLDVFPIDTWVKQTISTKYKIKNDTKTIEKFAKEKYGVYSALAIQYMFHYGRNVKKENDSC